MTNGIHDGPRHHFTVAGHMPAVLGPLRGPAAALVDRALGLPGLNAIYQSIPRHLDPGTFAACTLERCGVEAMMDPNSLNNIPERGPCIVVANHPHGALDGVAMIDLLSRRRGDFRVMANHLLEHFAELREVFIGVDPFGGQAARRYNGRAVRKALKWLRQGGLLMMFPGGEVSSLDLRQRRIVDPDWDSGIGWLVEKSGAPVVPAYINGRNSLGFQLAGLVHPTLRTALLVREMQNHRGTALRVKCAPPIDADTLSLLGGRGEIAPYLQTSTYLIQARSQYRRPLRLGSVVQPGPEEHPIAGPVEPARLASEVDALPETQRLVAGERLEVWYAKADQIPWLLQEIGRLRELSFRQVGEGTGKTVDLDLYDTYYLHLFIWDRESHAVVGGYRLGEADRILARYGSKGLYVRSLFKLAPQLEDELRTALEVGRSFVRPEHQRNYASLMLLWKGIAAYVVRQPRYRVLFGPVSISNDYHPVSQQLMVRFLQRTSMELERASQVKPRNPFRGGSVQTKCIDLDVSDLRIIANLLTTVEHGDTGVPVLLRQYLKLNGRILGFNVDPDFNNAIDCLLWVDLTRTDASLLRKYMGREGVERFLRYHGMGEQAAGG
ncbi:MAG: lysophospholipid acyltransferase family protein [Gammaproteobacteria bacterium]